MVVMTSPSWRRYKIVVFPALGQSNAAQRTYRAPASGHARAPRAARARAHRTATRTSRPSPCAPRAEGGPQRGKVSHVMYVCLPHLVRHRVPQRTAAAPDAEVSMSTNARLSRAVPPKASVERPHPDFRGHLKACCARPAKVALHDVCVAAWRVADPKRRGRR